MQGVQRLALRPLLQKPQAPYQSSIHPCVQESEQEAQTLMIPDLRAPDPNRSGITADTVTIEDVVNSLLKVTPEGTRLAHEEALRNASKDLDRYSITGQSMFTTRSLKSVESLIETLEHQILVTKMLRRRIMEVRRKENKRWINQTADNPYEQE